MDKNFFRKIPQKLLQIDTPLENLPIRSLQ